MRLAILWAGAFAVAGSASAVEIYRSAPSDDIWAYENSIDPSFDPFIRVFGNTAQAVDNQWPPSNNFSYGYLRFDLSRIPRGKVRIVSATLTVTHTRNPGYSRALGEQFPLELRRIEPLFDEPTWDFFGENEEPMNVIATASLIDYVERNATFPIRFNLRNPAFQSWFNQALNRVDRRLGLAFTSRMNPSDQFGSQYYRFYTKDDPGLRGPVLEVRYERLESLGQAIFRQRR